MSDSFGTLDDMSNNPRARQARILWPFSAAMLEDQDEKREIARLVLKGRVQPVPLSRAPSWPKALTWPPLGESGPFSIRNRRIPADVPFDRTTGYFERPLRLVIGGGGKEQADRLLRLFQCGGVEKSNRSGYRYSLASTEAVMMLLSWALLVARPKVDTPDRQEPGRKPDRAARYQHLVLHWYRLNGHKCGHWECPNSVAAASNTLCNWHQLVYNDLLNDRDEPTGHRCNCVSLYMCHDRCIERVCEDCFFAMQDHEIKLFKSSGLPGHRLIKELRKRAELPQGPA